jgi:DNA invertase Pin-like site-specific DNA recombinase
MASLTDPDVFIKDYYKKGLAEFRENKRGVIMKKNNEPLSFNEAVALFTKEYKEILPKYRREMLDAKAQGKIGISLMPRWFILSDILKPEVQDTSKTVIDLFDADKEYGQFAIEHGLYCYFSILHTANPMMPTLLVAFLVENNASV